MENLTIRKRIKKLREEHRLTQTEFAEQLGVCRSSVINLETSAKLVSPRITDIAKVLRTTEEYLVFGIEQEENQLHESYAEEMLDEKVKALTKEYESLLYDLREEIEGLKAICDEQRRQIDIAKRTFLNSFTDTTTDEND